jgi:hypothetical protein
MKQTKNKWLSSRVRSKHEHHRGWQKKQATSNKLVKSAKELRAMSNMARKQFRHSNNVRTSNLPRSFHTITAHKVATKTRCRVMCDDKMTRCRTDCFGKGRRFFYKQTQLSQIFEDTHNAQHSKTWIARRRPHNNYKLRQPRDAPWPPSSWAASTTGACKVLAPPLLKSPLKELTSAMSDQESVDSSVHCGQVVQQQWRFQVATNNAGENLPPLISLRKVGGDPLHGGGSEPVMLVQDSEDDNILVATTSLKMPDVPGCVGFCWRIFVSEARTSERVWTMFNVVTAAKTDNGDDENWVLL